MDARPTFTHCERLYTSINRIKEDERIDIVLVGNKSDLPQSEHKVSYNEVEQKAREWNVPFVLTSAKDNTNIKEAFELAVREIGKHKDEPLTIEPNPGCCCQIL